MISRNHFVEDDFECTAKKLHDKSLESMDHDEIHLYKGDPALPVYRWGLKNGMCTDDVAELLVNRCIDRSRIATRGPTSVENNTVFIVDTSKISEKDDLKCDDSGAWECKGSKKSYYYKDEDGKLGKLAKDKLPDEQVGVFVIQRQWYRNSSMNSLQRIIITPRDSVSTVPKDLVFIQYIFNNGEQPVTVNLHGNAKSARCGAYQRTMQSTRKMIKDNIGALPARSIVHKVINERGGIMKIGSSGALPRNRTQVYNITREVKKQAKPFGHIEDPMLQVLAKAKEEQQGRAEDIFIREIPLSQSQSSSLPTNSSWLILNAFALILRSFVY